MACGVTRTRSGVASCRLEINPETLRNRMVELEREVTETSSGERDPPMSSPLPTICGWSPLREETADVLPNETLDVVHPELLPSDEIATIWSAAVGRIVSYRGDDLDALDEQFKTSAPGWKTYDMRLMMQRFQRDGMTAKPEDDRHLQTLLGHPLRSYRELALETAATWRVSQGHEAVFSQTRRRPKPTSGCATSLPRRDADVRSRSFSRASSVQRHPSAKRDPGRRD